MGAISIAHVFERDQIMCDYSAESASRRDAKVGDQLVVGQISHHTVGLKSANDPDGPAVCILSGSDVLVDGMSDDFRDRNGLGTGMLRAKFAQRDVVRGVDYRDSLSFKVERRVGAWARRTHEVDGELILLQHFEPGVRVSVESVPNQIDDLPTARPATQETRQSVAA